MGAIFTTAQSEGSPGCGTLQLAFFNTHFTETSQEAWHLLAEMSTQRVKQTSGRGCEGLKDKAPSLLTVMNEWGRGLYICRGVSSDDMSDSLAPSFHLLFPLSSSFSKAPLQHIRKLQYQQICRLNWPGPPLLPAHPWSEVCESNIKS